MPEPQPSWDMVNWLTGAVIAAWGALAAAFGHIRNRMNRLEDAALAKETEARAQTAAIREEVIKLITERHYENVRRLDQIQNRLDQTPTREELREWARLSLASQAGRAGREP